MSYAIRQFIMHSIFQGASKQTNVAFSYAKNATPFNVQPSVTKKSRSLDWLK